VCFIDDVDRLVNKKDIDAVLKLITLVKNNMTNIVLMVAVDPKIFLDNKSKKKNGVL